MKHNYLLITALLLLLAPAAWAQVGIGTSTPDANAALDIQATGKGLLIPRMDSASRAGITAPPDGLMVFQTDGRAGFWYAIGGSWVFIPDKTRSGDNLGNHTATQNLNLAGKLLVGGTAATPGTAGVFVDPNGRVGLGIGTTTPYSRLANTSANIVGSDAQGGNGNSLAWAGGQGGYIGMFYNSATGTFSNGLAVKVASTNNATGALDVSQNTAQATTGTNLFRVTGAGNVGIGTNNPRTRLSFASVNEPKITLWDGGSTTDHLGLGVSSSQLNFHVPANNNFVFYTGGKNGAEAGVSTELLRITSAGRLGLGVTGSPNGRFQVVTNATGFDDDYLFDQYGASGDQALYFRRAGGTAAAPTDLVGGEQIGAVAFGGRYGGTQNYANSFLRSFYRGDGTTSFTDLRLGTSGVERMRIDSAGFVGLGTSAPVSRLSFVNTVEPKITLFGNATTHYGFGISGNQLNYHVDQTASSHVFYAAGRNGNGTELLRLTGSGRLGLNTTGTPAGRLQLVNDNGGGGAADDYFIDEYGPGDQSLYFRRALGTAAAPADLAGGEQIGGIGFGARANGTQALGHSYIRSFYHGDGITDFTDLRFGTSLAERLRIDSVGFVGIGTTKPTARLDVNGSARLRGLSTAGVVVTDASGNLSSVAASPANGLFWNLGGNSGTDPATNFLGTTDGQDLVLRTNNVPRAQLTTGGALWLLNPSFNTPLGASVGTGGSINTFVGYGAGASNNGSLSTIVGATAGLFSTGSENTFVGAAAGYGAAGTSTGGGNVAVGRNAGASIAANGNNTYVGLYSGNDATGGGNVALGSGAGRSSTTGSYNTWLGTATTTNNRDGSNNTLVGAGADVAGPSLTNATALGYFATVGASNSLVLGGTGANAVSVGIGTTTPAKRLHVDANSDFLRVDNLASVSNTNNYLVIDNSGNVGKTTVENVAGQIIRLGFNGTAYTAGEKALRFDAHNTAAEMQNAATTASNFINTIAGATISEAQALAAGTGTPARTTDRIALPAGVYRVTVRLAGYFSGASAGNGAYVKFIVNNSEYSLEYTLANVNTVSNGDEVSDYLNLTAASTLDFTLNPFANTFNVDSRSTAGSGQSYRSLLLIERLR